MLYLTKATQRLGKPTDGNTVCDYDAEEIKRGFSISAAMAPVFRNGVKINMLDTPGYLDFAGEVVQVLRVVDGAIIVVDGKAGVEVGTELAWDNAHESGIPRAFLINKIDDPDAKFARVYDDIKDKFGSSVCPRYVPVKTAAGEGIIDLIGMFMYEYGAGGAAQKKDIPADCLALAEKYRGMLMESIAETSEALME
jgi:elongation factor G